jgi:YHS domain-containing protein
MKAAVLIGMGILALGLIVPGSAQKADVCIVDGKLPTKGGSVVSVNRKRLTLCSKGCASAFQKAPEKYLKIVAHCPVLENPVPLIKPERRIVLNNSLYYFCCGGCHGGFMQTPDKVKKIKDVVNGEVFEVGSTSPHLEYQGQHYLFVTDETKAQFEKEPAKYAVVFGK